MAPGAEGNITQDVPQDTVSATVIVYISVLMTLLVMSFVLMCMKMAHIGQKTRSPQQRRMYVGSRARPSLGPHEPTIYVSPSNLPPPPKYECMAPPSYEEVVGIHYPNYQVQPIAQPIAAALAQSSPSTTAQANDTRPNETPTRPNETPTRPNETPTRSNEDSVVTVNERATASS